MKKKDLDKVLKELTSVAVAGLYVDANGNYIKVTAETRLKAIWTYLLYDQLTKLLTRLAGVDNSQGDTSERSQ